MKCPPNAYFLLCPQNVKFRIIYKYIDGFLPLKSHQCYWTTEKWTSQKWSPFNRKHIACGESRKYILQHNENAQNDGKISHQINSLRNFVPVPRHKDVHLLHHRWCLYEHNVCSVNSRLSQSSRRRASSFKDSLAKIHQLH